MIGPLGWTVVAPLLCGILALAVPVPRLARLLGLGGSLVPLVIGVVALSDFARHPGADFRLQEFMPWSENFGIAWRAGVDGISAAMLALAGLVTVVATLAAWHEARSPRLYHALVLLLLAAMCGVFVTLDFVVFYVCWEVMLVPMLALIGIYGGAQRRYAALKFFVFTLAGSVLMLGLLLALLPPSPRPDAARSTTVQVAPALLAACSTDQGRTLHGLAVRDGSVSVPHSYDLRHLALQHARWRQQPFLGTTLAWFGFLALLLACLVKVPAVPLHTWLPHAHVQAPTAVSVLLAGVLLKLGVYGLYRIAWPLFPAEAAACAPWFGALGVLGILWGAWVALGQSDWKRLVAYSSVSHMGFCLLGLAALTVAGAVGGMVQAVTHGLSSSLLFLLVGLVYERVHHRRLDGLGGLAQPMPRFAWILLVAALASAGLPGLAGFVGEFMVLTGGFVAGPTFAWLSAAATLSVVVSAGYLLWMVKRVAYGPLRQDAHAGLADCRPIELAALLPLVVLIVVLGVWPAPLVDALRPACEALILQVRSVVP